MPVPLEADDDPLPGELRRGGAGWPRSAPAREPSPSVAPNAKAPAAKPADASAGRDAASACVIAADLREPMLQGP